MKNPTSPASKESMHKREYWEQMAELKARRPRSSSKAATMARDEARRLKCGAMRRMHNA